MKQLSDTEARRVRDAFDSVVGSLPPAPEWDEFETERPFGTTPRRHARLRPALAVGIAASVVLILIGGLSWWLGGDGSGTEPAIPTPPTVDDLPTPNLTESQSWVNPEGGISLTLDRYEIPARPGLHEIEVAGAFEPYSRLWECRGLHGVLEPAADIGINEACTELEAMQTTGTRRAVFVTVDRTVIDEGSLAIAVNGALGSWAGTARITIAPRAPDTVTTGLGQISWESAVVDGELVDLHFFDGAFVARQYSANGSDTRFLTSSDGLTWSGLKQQPPGEGVVYEYDGALWTMGPQLTPGPFGDVPSVFRLDSLDGEWTQAFAEPGGRIQQEPMWFAAGPAGALVLGATDDGRARVWVYGDVDDDSGSGSLKRFNVIDFDPILSSLPMPPAGTPDTDAGYANLVRSVDFFPVDNGFFAAVAIAGADGTVEEPMWLWSDNGTKWTQVAGPPTAARPAPFPSIAHIEGLVLAVGEGIWAAADSETWTRVATSPPDIPPTDTVAAGPAGWVMPVGQAGIFWDSADLMVSPNGVNWEIAIKNVPAVLGMLMTEDTLLVSTSTGGWSGDPIHEIWVGTITP